MRIVLKTAGLADAHDQDPTLHIMSVMMAKICRLLGSGSSNMDWLLTQNIREY